MKTLKPRRRLLIKIFSLILTCFVLLAGVFWLGNKILHPKVILGGQTISVDYEEEGIYYIFGYDKSRDENIINSDVSILQIGEIPILSKKYIENALNKYSEESIEVKTMRGGRIYRKVEMVKMLNNMKLFNGGSGKICMYIPQISNALAFAHPVTLGEIRGTAYKAKSIGINREEYDYSIDVERLAETIGYIQENDTFGIIIKYNKAKIETEDAVYIEIARKKEVKLGKAFLYTDFGEGLQYYEIEVSKLDDCYENEEYPFFRDKSLNEAEFEKEKFQFLIKDERFFEAELNVIISGMSGSPIIQDGKLIGFAGYDNGEYSMAIYAEDAYWDTMIKFWEGKIK